MCFKGVTRKKWLKTKTTSQEGVNKSEHFLRSLYFKKGVRSATKTSATDVLKCKC